MSSDIISTTEAARILGYTRQYVSELIRAGKLPAQMVGNSWVLRLADVMEYQAQQKKGRQDIGNDG